MGLSFQRRKRTHLLRTIARYSVSSTDQAAFFIGGYDEFQHGSTIAKYENDEWSLYGNLKKRRNSHRSIISGTETIVFGGFINMQTK